MTPQGLVALAACLIELREWLEANDFGSLDVALVDEAVNVAARVRRRLLEEGAK